VSSETEGEVRAVGRRRWENALELFKGLVFRQRISNELRFSFTNHIVLQTGCRCEEFR